MLEHSTHAAWRKSSYSSSNGECLELHTPSPHEEVHIRDSKNPSEAILIFHISAWSSFVAAVQAGVLALVRSDGETAVGPLSEHTM